MYSPHSWMILEPIHLSGCFRDSFVCKEFPVHGWRRCRCWPSSDSQVGHLLWKTVWDPASHCGNLPFLKSWHIPHWVYPYQCLSGLDCITVFFTKHSSCEAKLWHFTMKAVLWEVIPFTISWLFHRKPKNQPHMSQPDQVLAAWACCSQQSQTKLSFSLLSSSPFSWVITLNTEVRLNYLASSASIQSENTFRMWLRKRKYISDISVHPSSLQSISTTSWSIPPHLDSDTGQGFPTLQDSVNKWQQREPPHDNVPQQIAFLQFHKLAEFLELCRTVPFSSQCPNCLLHFLLHGDVCSKLVLLSQFQLLINTFVFSTVNAGVVCCICWHFVYI